MSKPTTTLLIDGDVILYRQSCSCEVELEWEPDVWTLHCDLHEVKSKVSAFLADLQSTFKAQKTIIALSCPAKEGFRRALSPAYKQHRDSKRKPVGYPALRQWAIETLGAKLVPRLEADDILGIEATRPVKDEERIVVSLDKDFRGVPCRFYNWMKMEDGVTVVSKEEAERFHATQTLTGDSCDGYSGCPGVGPKTAEKILAGKASHELWPAVVSAYIERGFGEAEALLNARLARICQFEDLNQEKNGIKLWTPKTPPKKPKQS